MSFLNNIGGLLNEFTGAAPEQIESATAQHVDSMDSGELAGHLTSGAQNMNSGMLGNLASSLLGSLSNHGQNAAAVDAAGVSTDAAQSGDPSAVTSLIEHAQQNPGALKDAAIDFIKNNPQAVEQFAPGFLKGILSKFSS